MDGLETEVKSWSGVIFSKIWSPLAPHCYNCADLCAGKQTDGSKKSPDLFTLSESFVYLWSCLSFKFFTLFGSQQPGSTLLLCWDSNKSQAHKHPLEFAVPHACDGASAALYSPSCLHSTFPLLPFLWTWPAWLHFPWPPPLQGDPAAALRLLSSVSKTCPLTC